MATALQEELTDAVLRTALEPDAWGEVMRLLKLRFPSEAQTFYFLNLQPRQVRPVSLLGVEPRWRESFDRFYFASDNPWIRLTRELHRPGVVRTNERLERLLGDPLALYRSAYYNDWMRPQGFKYSLGTTLFADEASVANITLLRSPQEATFDDGEVRAFEALSRHLTRSLQISVRLERAETGPHSQRSFDALPQAVAVVDAHLQLLYANRAMESLLRTAHGLALHQGALRASQPKAQQRLRACIAAALASLSGDADASQPLLLTLHAGVPLTLYAVPVTGTPGRFVASKPMVLLMGASPCDDRCASCDELRERYGFTGSEARLARFLVQGSELHQAAEAMGITYNTARGYLKVMFEKAVVHSQAQLVSRILRETVR